MTKTKKTPFRDWLSKQPSTDPKKAARGATMSVPEFVELAIKKGVVTAKVNTLYKSARGAVPRNLALYEKAFPGIQF